MVSDETRGASSFFEPRMTDLAELSLRICLSLTLTGSNLVQDEAQVILNQPLRLGRDRQAQPIQSPLRQVPSKRCFNGPISLGPTRDAT